MAEIPALSDTGPILGVVTSTDDTARLCAKCGVQEIEQGHVLCGGCFTAIQAQARAYWEPGGLGEQALARAAGQPGGSAAR